MHEQATPQDPARYRRNRPVRGEQAIGEKLAGKPEPKVNEPTGPDTRNPAAVALAKLGASKGGKARAAKLRPKQRSAIAKKAAQIRWDIQEVSDGEKKRPKGTKAKAR